ncbi:hypothetical protein AB0L04_00665 [Streptomyces glaucescens]|uniref:hypothetical protein n=1 Tax=Streptomyces glaucescens TaxID=1907 RepID=UPI00344F1091
MIDDAPAPACTICNSHLFDHELTHQACRPCTDRIDQQLRALAGPEGLYARLAHSLAPGSSGGGPVVSGSRTAPLPLRLDPLSLAARGGVVTILQTWLVDWHDLLGYRHPRWEGDLQQQLDQVVHRLRVLLPWAAEQHGAIAEFGTELASLVRQCRAATGSEKPPRRVGVSCTCGHTLRVTLDTAGVRCPACSTQYGHSEALRLPLAERRAA